MIEKYSEIVDWNQNGYQSKPNSPLENTTPFVALRCSSAQDFASGLCCERPDPVIRVMGDAADPEGPQGKFYLYTNEKIPMAKDTPQESTSCQWIDFT